MKFTDGYWLLPAGFTALRAAEVRDVEVDSDHGRLIVYATTRVVRDRGDTLNAPLLTVTFSSPASGVVGVRIAHHEGYPRRRPGFEFTGEPGFRPVVWADPDAAVLVSGDLVVTVRRGPGWQVEFSSARRVLTTSTARSVAAVIDDQGQHYVHEQLTLSPGEAIYGLGERFGPAVRNGQSVDIWNADGGTSSEQAYKNVPFFLSSRGYGVLVNDPGRVSFEIASEAVERTQFSVPGQSLEYLLIDGPTPADVLRRYTALAGRPAALPAWSFGLWLSTSFTTSYDEATITGFVDGMAERGLPLSVFHFDCFWMREFHWTDFVWDPEAFPDPGGMLARLKARGLRICVWINPYIAQRSRLFREGAERGYLVHRPDGSVWQWDLWQAGMGLVDFTNPDARKWFTGYLRQLLDLGVDCFKTDFGERIPTEVTYHDGSDPVRMHNYYTHLYNRAVFDTLREVKGEGEAVLFARSATAGGQQFPVHWGGDNESTFASMAGTLRGGLSLGLSGFGYWSHDIGGFEGTPDPLLFKRWLAFGLLSSHSRLHGSGSVRVPWSFDEEAVAITGKFTRLKHRLMPYLARIAEQAHSDGLPMLRHLVLEFPDDPAVRQVDTEYLLGDSLLVAPVLEPSGEVEFYLPQGRWVSLLDGSAISGGRWLRQLHAVDSLPLLVRPGTVLPLGAVDDRPDYDWADGVTLLADALAEGDRCQVHVPRPAGQPAQFVVERTGGLLTATGPQNLVWSLRLDARTVAARGGRAELTIDDREPIP